MIRQGPADLPDLPFANRGRPIGRSIQPPLPESPEGSPNKQGHLIQYILGRHQSALNSSTETMSTASFSLSLPDSDAVTIAPSVSSLESAPLSTPLSALPPSSQSPASSLHRRSAHALMVRSLSSPEFVLGHQLRNHHPHQNQNQNQHQHQEQQQQQLSSPPPSASPVSTTPTTPAAVRFQTAHSMSSASSDVESLQASIDGGLRGPIYGHWMDKYIAIPEKLATPRMPPPQMPLPPTPTANDGASTVSSLASRLDRIRRYIDGTSPYYDSDGHFIQPSTWSAKPASTVGAASTVSIASTASIASSHHSASTKFAHPTLSDLLRSRRRRLDLIMLDNQHFSDILRYLIGSPDPSLSVYDMWFPSLRCYQLITTRFLHLPTIDLGKSKVTPTLRGAILLASSLEYRCFYSAARSASFGDAMSGSARSHLWRSKTYTGEYPVPIISPSDSRLSKEESVALHLAVSAAQIPSKVTPEHKSTARSFYKGEDYQQIATICAYTGWINAFSDAMGIDLDPGSYLWAKVQLRDSLWDGSRHAPFNYDPSQGHDQLRERAQAEEYIPKHGISKARDILKILKSMQGSNSSEAQWIRGFPAGHRLLNSWLHEQFGFKPSYVEVILNRDTKRTVCYLLWQVLLRASWDNLTGAHCQCEWSAASKALLWYAYAAHSGNTLVQAHAGYLAFRLKVPVSTITMVGGNGYLGDRRMDAALEFFRESAQMTRDYSPSQSMRLFEVMKTPSGVVELISLLGMCALVHRLSVTLAPDPLRFEPEVAQFLTTDAGSALLIDPSTPYLGLVK